MSEWVETTIGKFCPFAYGKALKESNRSNSGEFPVIGSGGPSGSHSEALSSGPTTVIGRKGSVGTTYFAPGGCWPIDTTFFVADVEERDPKYTFYLLSSLGLSAMNSDSAVPGLNRDAAHAVAVCVPPLQEQRAIAGVLGALDDKIESNRQLVALLEQIGRTELASRLEGDNGEAWESAWPETSLGEVLSLIETGDRPKGGVSQVEDGVPSIGAESIVAPGVFDYSKTKFVPREYFEKMKRGVLHSGDVLLYKDGGTPGNFIPKVSMYQDDFPFPVAAINSHVYRLRVREPYSQAFLYFWLSSQRMLDEMWLRGTGAAIPSLNSTNVKGLPFPVVPLDRLHPVLDVLDQYFARLHRSAREARTLELLRNALMPELLSGRLRLRDAEEVVGEVV